MKLLGLPRFELALVAEGAIPLATPLAGCSASEVAEFLHRTVGRPAREQLSVLLLDGRKRVIGYHLAFSGTLGRAPVEPYGVFVPALLANASFVLLCHGHPTGEPALSPEDIEVTLRLEKCGEALGIPVLDHFVLGEAPAFASWRWCGCFS